LIIVVVQLIFEHGQAIAATRENEFVFEKESDTADFAGEWRILSKRNNEN
jgi:hypothetical protein